MSQKSLWTLSTRCPQPLVRTENTNLPPTSTMQTTLHIDAYVDVICPWCWIGKRHLEKAMDALRQEDVTVQTRVHWHPVQLLPELPSEGVPFETFYLHRLGSAAAVRARQAQVNAAAAHADLHIDFSRIARMPNTALALRLVAYASAHGTSEQVNAVMDKLFQAHFLQSLAIGDPATVLNIAQQCRLDVQAVQAVLDKEDGPPLQSDVPLHSGVPYFVFNGQLALAGAQPPHVLLQAMQRALELPMQAMA